MYLKRFFSMLADGVTYNEDYLQQPGILNSVSINHIAVVGGGIGGLASAIFLCRKGYKITVYEQASGPGPVGAGFLLQPPGQMVLAELGVLDDVLAQSMPIHRLTSETVNGHRILDLHYSDLKGIARPGLGVQRSTIYHALYSAAATIDGIDFRWDCTVSSCRVDDGGVIVSTSDSEHHYDYCLLSSGANSTIADSRFDGKIRNRYKWGCLWSTIKLPEGLSPNTLHQRCQSSGRMMGILPVGVSDCGHDAALYWSVKVKQYSEMDRDQFPAVRDEVCSFWPAASSSIETLGYSDFSLAVYNDNWTPRPYNDRLIALGDISHATSPQLGQGCTMALLDAWLLDKCLDTGQSLDKVSAKWWSLRKPQLAYVRHLSRFLTPFYQSDNRGFGVVRDWLMAPMGRVPPIYHLQLRTLASEVLLKTEVQ